MKVGHIEVSANRGGGRIDLKMLNSLSQGLPKQDQFSETLQPKPPENMVVSFSLSIL